jgi:hypothetical protein
MMYRTQYNTQHDHTKKNYNKTELYYNICGFNNITEATKNALQITRDILVDRCVFKGIITTAKQKRLVRSVNKMFYRTVSISFLKPRNLLCFL